MQNATSRVGHASRSSRGLRCSYAQHPMPTNIGEPRRKVKQAVVWHKGFLVAVRHALGVERVER